MATIKFLLRGKKNPAKITLRLVAGRGNIFRAKTGYEIDPDKWSFETNMPKKGGDADQKNLKTKLKDLSNFIEKELNKATEKGDEINGDWLHHKIDSFQGKKKKTELDRLTNYVQFYIDNLKYKEFPNNKKGTTKATEKKYTTIKNKLLNFEEDKKKKYYLRDVGPDFRNDFLKYLTKVDKLGSNTAGRYIRFLKTICVDAKGKFDVHPELDDVKGFSEKVAKIFLSFDELELIENTRYEREALQNAKDWLIIGCYIGQRVSDLLRLTNENIQVRNGLELLELTQIKTGKEVAIPLHPKVKEILNKRNGNFPSKLSAVNFNLHIKDIAKEAAIDTPTEGGKMVYDEKNEIYRKKFGVYPKHELITSHVCRRSFASNFYGEIPTALLISITAHSTEKQFLEYIGKSPNDYAIQLAEYWSKEALQKKKEPQMQVLKNAN